jgi:hypothetical protein
LADFVNQAQIRTRKSCFRDVELLAEMLEGEVMSGVGEVMDGYG